MSKIVVLLDSAHGMDTKGKCSPDRSLLEWQWSREIVAMIENTLMAKGIQVHRIVPENNDVALSTRCQRVNNYCKRYGTSNCVLISPHINASGADGKWHDARGFSVWVAKNASAKSKDLAKDFQLKAESLGLKGNRCVPSCKYWEANFYILKNTACPAVLTENLFQDNKEDCEFLKTKKAKELIADLHVDTIVEYINKYGK